MRWFRRTLSGEERRMYNQQARSVAAEIRQWKLAADEFGRPASKKDMIEARMTAWETPRVSEKMEEELRFSAALIQEQGYDDELETRCRKVSLAMCLLKLLDKMKDSAVKSNNSTMLTGVAALHDRMMWLLDDAYFFKDEYRITDEYLGLQPTLVACGRITGVEVPGLEQMFLEHHLEAADKIGLYRAEIMNTEYEKRLAAQ